jgi:hypothetical protein
MADVRRKLSPPDEVALRGDGLKPLLALVSNEPFFQNPREQKRDPGTIKLDNIPGRDVVYVRWIVSGAGKPSVEVRSVKGGSDRKE